MTTMREVISTDAAPAAAGPYSQAIRAGELVFTAGQLGIEAAGSGLDRLVKVTVYLADIADWPAVNEVYAREVPQPFPARSAFAVRDLPKGARVEIEAVATVDVG
jgi:2-iminobutanoate/2-iminopropanoate deaminase